MLLLGTDTEPQHDYIKERRLWQLYTPGAVVIASVEMQLVNPGTVVIALQQRRIATAIAVGQGAGDQLHLRPFNPIQLDLDSAARAAMCGVQNVCSQTSH